jgi:phage terminase large subunit-like protein
LQSLTCHPEYAAHVIRSEAEWEQIVHDWMIQARNDQLAPWRTAAGQPWRTWLILGGRGSGKTGAGAEWVRAQAAGQASSPWRMRSLGTCGPHSDVAVNIA